jgi:hypothetical protein
MTLPWLVQTGGTNESIRLIAAMSNGLCGAIHGANSAPPMQSNATTAAAIVTGERRKL